MGNSNIKTMLDSPKVNVAGHYLAMALTIFLENLPVTNAWVFTVKKQSKQTHKQNEN